MKNERRKYMNNSKQDILNNLIKEPFINQRILAAQTGHSLGIVNRSIKELISEGYLDEEIRPTEKTLREAKEKAPKNAIILAAGFGMRMVPINTETPKGLLEIKGERLIERTIRQLHEVGITEIYVVVGFMKEQYEYLIDEYGVELIVAPDYDIPHDPAVAPFQALLGLGKYVLGEVAVHPLLKQEGIPVIVDLIELSQCRREISLR